MTRENLTALIDRVIGKKGILRSPAWWVRRLFEKVIEYGESYTQNAINNVKVEVDSEMSDESENAVSNKVIKAYVDNAITTTLNTEV